ncbi:hypothetical protein [Priestia aryabhattai]|uniref:hypothetical protein n=1 Tax=Priestia aryabhattai TaxID=412384 RepID=UPI001120BDB5|nr:hypothetical protein [Priestia aryabhattai]
MIVGQGEDSRGKRSLARKSTAVEQTRGSELLIQIICLQVELILLCLNLFVIKLHSFPTLK